MFVVLFEVQPKPDRRDDYLETARLLRPELERIDGFLDNERYRCDRTEGRVLSLSTWRDEKALIRWRTQATHHTVGQTRGRFELFADYRLRVGEMIADSHPPSGALPRPTRLDPTEVGAATVVTIVETTAALLGADADRSPPHPSDIVERETFTALSHPDRRLLLVAWRDGDHARPMASAASAASAASDVRERLVRIIREYGMRDRREAPQYFPDVANAAPS